MATDLRAEIDSCAYLFLREIDEPEENRLRIVVQEAEARSESETVVVGELKISDTHRVESRPDHGVFEIVWNSYIVYCVTNESFSTRNAEDEKRESGHHFRTYSKSHFLDYVVNRTVASSDYPGPFQHLSVVCENHIIDVVSVESPQIRRLAGGAKHIM